MGRILKHFEVLAISLIILKGFAQSLDFNTLSTSSLVQILRTNGVEENLITSIVKFREKEGWIWSCEELLLCGVPDEMLSWFSYRFSFPPPVNVYEVSPDLADFFLFPIDLNSASSTVLAFLPGMTEKRLRDIFDYRKRKGFVSVKELLHLGWTTEEVRRVAPFVTVSSLPQTFRWFHSLRLEGTNVLYRTSFVLLPIEVYGLFSSPLASRGNLLTIQTQAVFGGMVSLPEGKVVGGDFRYRQGIGLLFGNPVSIISRYPSDMVSWEKGLSRPYSISRDLDGNKYEEIFRGLAGEIQGGVFSLGGLATDNPYLLRGGWGKIHFFDHILGIQGFVFSFSNTNRVMGSFFSRIGIGTMESGLEYAHSGGDAWIIWMRSKGRIQLALVGYQGASNFFAPFGGQLYRGVQGRLGALASLFFRFSWWECLLRGEWYTNTKTTYTTTKMGIEGALKPKIGNELFGLKQIGVPFSWDIRTNQVFVSGGCFLEGWFFHLFNWEAKFRLHHYSGIWGEEYHWRTSIGVERWQISVWYSLLSPLRANPISMTFPPVESEEMESLWFYRKTHVVCGVVRYRKKEFSLATRVLTYEKSARFAMSFQWQW